MHKKFRAVMVFLVGFLIARMATVSFAAEPSKLLIKAAQIKPEEVADMSYCKRFEDSGFFRSLY